LPCAYTGTGILFLSIIVFDNTDFAGSTVLREGEIFAEDMGKESVCPRKRGSLPYRCDFSIVEFDA
jgi:hypothetical protein